MTKEELASKLNGREYGEEITPEEEAEAKASGLVVIFSASDDLMEFRGAIDNEVSVVGNHGFVCLTSTTGMLQKVIALQDCYGYAWSYKTELSHATFDIMNDGARYCRGIVIELPKGDSQ